METPAWTKGAAEEARRLLESGRSAREIAAQFGTTRNAILGAIHRLRHADADRYGGGAGRRGDKARDLSIVEMYLSGLRYADIAERHGVPIHSIANALKRRGITPNRLSNDAIANMRLAARQRVSRSREARL